MSKRTPHSESVQRLDQRPSARVSSPNLTLAVCVGACDLQDANSCMLFCNELMQRIFGCRRSDYVRPRAAHRSVTCLTTSCSCSIRKASLLLNTVDTPRLFFSDLSSRDFPPQNQAAGATVIAAASTPEKLEACRESGADMLLKYRGQDRDGNGDSGSWREALKRLIGKRGVDVVLDVVGGSDCEVSVR